MIGIFFNPFSPSFFIKTQESRKVKLDLGFSNKIIVNVNLEEKNRIVLLLLNQVQF